MAILISELITAKARKFGASETSVGFIQICIDSLNYVISDINERLYTTIPLIQGSDESINVDQGTYQGLISLGLDMYITDQGQWSVQNLENVRANYLNKLKTVQMNHQRGLSLKYKFGDVDSVTG
jgi:hypothetical protein